MELSIYFSDSNDGFLLKNDIPKGISVSPQYITVQKGFGDSIPVTMFISFARDVSIGLISAWLYDKLKNCSSEKITIDRKEIILEKGEIAHIIEEKMIIE